MPRCISNGDFALLRLIFTTASTWRWGSWVVMSTVIVRQLINSHQLSTVVTTGGHRDCFQSTVTLRSPNADLVIRFEKFEKRFPSCWFSVLARSRFQRHWHIFVTLSPKSVFVLRVVVIYFQVSVYKFLHIFTILFSFTFFISGSIFINDYSFLARNSISLSLSQVQALFISYHPT